MTERFTLLFRANSNVSWSQYEMLSLQDNLSMHTFKKIKMFAYLLLPPQYSRFIT